MVRDEKGVIAMKRKMSEWREQELRQVPLFAECTPHELADIDEQGAEILVEAGEVLVREGNPGRQTFIIIAGEAVVTAGGRKIAHLGAGDFFGEMAVLTQRPRAATVRAASPMRVVVLDPRELGEILRVPGVTRAMLVGVVDRLYEVEGQMA
jgi:cAMP-dependent protein kinase regulator